MLPVNVLLHMYFSFGSNTMPDIDLICNDYSHNWHLASGSFLRSVKSRVLQCIAMVRANLVCPGPMLSECYSVGFVTLASCRRGLCCCATVHGP